MGRQARRKAAARAAQAPPPWTPFVRMGLQPDGLSDLPPALRQRIQGDLDSGTEEIYRNSRYQVNVRRTGVLLHLSIKRVDKEAIHDWRDLQRIKNELVGPECEAVELYPAESRLVDSANQFHLWAVPDPAFRFPLGWVARFVSAVPYRSSVQRAWEPDNTPPDLLGPAEVDAAMAAGRPLLAPSQDGLGLMRAVLGAPDEKG